MGEQITCICALTVCRVTLVLPRSGGHLVSVLPEKGVPMARPPGYPEEFRREAVQLALACDTSWASVARRLGVK